MFSEEEIQQLKEMHEKEFGEKIDDVRIIECTQMLLDFLNAIYKSSHEK